MMYDTSAAAAAASAAMRTPAHAALLQHTDAGSYGLQSALLETAGKQDEVDCPQGVRWRVVHAAVPAGYLRPA